MGRPVELPDLGPEGGSAQPCCSSIQKVLAGEGDAPSSHQAQAPCERLPPGTLVSRAPLAPEVAGRMEMGQEPECVPIPSVPFPPPCAEMAVESIKLSWHVGRTAPRYRGICACLF